MTPHSGEPLSVPVDAIVMILLPAAREGKLVLCAGAGLSRADDAGLPSGRQLGELLDARLSGRLAGYASPANPSNLLDVADAAAAASDDLLALQNEVLELADFERATPNFGHRALALLLAEGAVSTLLLWNWDDCVERSALEGERLQVARTREDMDQLRVPSVAKIHGCATRVRTLLITSEQLEEPPLWTEQAFIDKLRGSTGVFVGIGDVADYAQRRLRELRRDVPEADIYVVAPEIRLEWDQSVWAKVMPDLDEARRVAKTADVFLDELARIWALELVEAVEALAEGMAAEPREGVRRVLTALKQRCGSDVVKWWREAGFRRRLGQSVIRSTEAHEAAIALGVLAAETGSDVEILSDGRARLDESVLEILLVGEATNATQVRSEAERRAHVLADRGQVVTEAVFLVAGAVIGPLSQPDAVDIYEGEVDETDVFHGSRAVAVSYTSVSDVLARAA
jgi:hypothetical protein